ncbi:hypothetical protein BDC45DRAFT_510140 [Circinella umbellata]|nr:hypothetical protein BDC45DRAFT_510140 [Circinella umbellata]
MFISYFYFLYIWKGKKTVMIIIPSDGAPSVVFRSGRPGVMSLFINFFEFIVTLSFLSLSFYYYCKVVKNIKKLIIYFLISILQAVELF